jgi:hypothetical protein
MGKLFATKISYIIQQSLHLLSLVLQIVQFAFQAVTEREERTDASLGLCPIREDKYVVRDTFVIAPSYTIYQTRYSSIKRLASNSCFVNRTFRRHMMQTQGFTLRSPNLLAVIQSGYTEDRQVRDAMEQTLKRIDEVSKYTIPEDSEPFQGTDYAGPGFRQECDYPA